MKKVLVILLWFFSLVFSFRPVYAAEPEQKPAATEQKPAEPAEKPLGPGWLSLDSSVGVADKWIALNKSLIIRVIQPTSAVGFSTRTTIKSNSITLTLRSTSRKRIGALDSMCPVCLAGRQRC